MAKCSSSTWCYFAMLRPVISSPRLCKSPISSSGQHQFQSLATSMTVSLQQPLAWLAYGNCFWAVLLQAALGDFHGLAKCQIDSVQKIKWLGFMIDLVKERVVVGTFKLEKLKQFLTSILNKPSISARDLAQVAGKIISLSPAVAPAALYSRTFFEAIKGSATWDTIFPNPSQVKSSLQFWLDNIDNFNGRPWWPNHVRLQAEVDASGVGFGGILSVPSQPPRSFLGTFNEQQARGSSTLREVLSYVGTVELAASSFPDELRNATILITGNNQGAISCVNNLRSPVLTINQELHRLFRISCSLQCDVLATWYHIFFLERQMPYRENQMLPIGV
jgi:hypothetical protein